MRGGFKIWRREITTGSRSTGERRKQMDIMLGIAGDGRGTGGQKGEVTQEATHTKREQVRGGELNQRKKNRERIQESRLVLSPIQLLTLSVKNM